MVVDEKWLHSEPMPPKESHRAWVDPGGGETDLSRLVA
jgi:hypothetical protein